MSLSRLILLTCLTIYIVESCSKRFSTECQNSMHFQFIILHPYSFMAHTSCSRKRVLNKAIHWARFCSVTLSCLTSNFTLGYLDNFTLGGKLTTVAQDVRRIVELGSELGLILNAAKCELVAHPSLVNDNPLLRLFTWVEPVDATLLGVPLYPGKFLNKVRLIGALTFHAGSVDRLCLVDSQDALILLRASFSTSRVQHL